VRITRRLWAFSIFCGGRQDEVLSCAMMCVPVCWLEGWLVARNGNGSESRSQWNSMVE
jgi:hypothetical protein